MGLRELTKPALTPREEQIAGLVAEGLTNREIAGRLRISERTADRHLEHIRQKLGVNSRARIASWYVEQSHTPAVAKYDTAPNPQLLQGSRPTARGIVAAPTLVVRRLRPRSFWAIGVLMLLAAAAVVGVSVGPALWPNLSSGPRITTFAGTGAGAVSDDGSRPLATDLLAPDGLTVSKNGEVYIAEGDRIRVVRNDMVSTAVGSNVPGLSGDGGPAQEAQLRLAGSGLSGLALDGAGNLFVADTTNNRVRKVTPGGVISTVLTAIEPRGIAIDERGDVFVAATYANQVLKLDPGGVVSVVAGTGHLGFSGDNGPAVAAELRAPEALAVDSGGDLYIADSGNDVVRKVTPDGRIVTIAGNGKVGSTGDGGPAIKAELYLPTGLAVDHGILYIADSANNKVRKVDVAGNISTLAGTGVAGFKGDAEPASIAQFNNPVALAVDTSGNLYIADQGNNRVRLIRLGTS